uniref:Uncharacterized protein n=2 Tax=Anguilla anguilla TaxID=7936 RepID=A0A0E9UNL6_ANGAN
MWSMEASRCMLGMEASCPSVCWVFSLRNMGPSMLWMMR